MLINMHNKDFQTRARAPSEQADLIWCDFYRLLLVFPLFSCLMFIIVVMKSAQALMMIVGAVQHTLCMYCVHRYILQR